MSNLTDKPKIKEYNSFVAKEPSPEKRSELKKILFNDGREFTHLKDSYPQIINDEELLLTAIGTCPNVYLEASDRFKKSLDFIEKAVSRTKQVLSKLNPKFIEENKDVIKGWIIQDTELFEHLPKKTQKDINFIKYLYRNGCGIIDGIPDEITQAIYDDKDVIRDLMEHGNSFDWASERLRGDPDFCKEMIAINPESFNFIVSSLKRDPRFVEDILRKDYSLIDLVPLDTPDYPQLLALHFELSPEFPNTYFISELFEHAGNKQIIQPIQNEILKAVFEVLDTKTQRYLTSYILREDQHKKALEENSGSLQEYTPGNKVRQWAVDRITTENLTHLSLNSKGIRNLIEDELLKRKTQKIRFQKSNKSKSNRKTINP